MDLLDIVALNDMKGLKDFLSLKPLHTFDISILKKAVKYAKVMNFYEVLSVFRDAIVDYYSPEFLISCSRNLFDLIKSSNILKNEKQGQRVASLVVLDNNDIFSTVNETGICSERKILQMKFDHPIVALMVNRFSAKDNPAISRPCDVCVPIIKESDPLFVCYFTNIYKEDSTEIKSVEVQFELACTLNIDGLKKDKNTYGKNNKNNIKLTSIIKFNVF